VSDLARFEDMASFRNLPVHPYEKVVPEIVFAILRKRLDEFHLFGRHLDAWIRQTSSNR